jgi:hypothetical protein
VRAPAHLQYPTTVRLSVVPCRFSGENSRAEDQNVREESSASRHSSRPTLLFGDGVRRVEARWALSESHRTDFVVATGGGFLRLGIRLPPAPGGSQPASTPSTICSAIGSITSGAYIRPDRCRPRNGTLRCRVHTRHLSYRVARHAHLPVRSRRTWIMSQAYLPNIVLWHRPTVLAGTSNNLSALVRSEAKAQKSYLSPS